MSRIINNKVLMLIMLLLVLSSKNILPQTGKLYGKVTDATTGEPVIGANVIINGTTLGASADAKGNFVILKVPPDVYSVTASALGYQKITYTKVEVIVDRSVELNFKLPDKSIQMEQVVIVAEKPKIIKDQTSTSNTISQEQMKAAPIEGIRGAMDLSTGFQKTDNGNYTVRGSGSYEVSFQINGVDQVSTSTSSPASTPGTEKANNSWKYDVNPLGVSQVQMISGGFSAEYGNAQAGVVKVVLKEGTPKITGEVRVEYRPAGQYHFGDYIYNKNYYEWQKWGNVQNWIQLKSDVKRDLKIDTRYKALYDYVASHPKDSSAKSMLNSIEMTEIQFAYNTWLKNHTPADDNPLGVYDYRNTPYQRYLIGIGGPLGKDPNLFRFYFSGEYRDNPTRLPTPEKDQIYQNYILNLSWQPLENHKFKFMGSFQRYRGGIWSGSDDIRWSGIPFVPDGTSSKYIVSVDPVRVEQTLAQSLNWVYTINPQSFIEANISHQKEDITLPYQFLISNTQDADKLDNEFDRNGSLLVEGSWWETMYYRQPFNFSTNYYQDSRANSYTATFDYTNQVLKTNMLKAGIKFNYWDLYNNAVNSSFQANTYVTRSGYAEYYHAYPINGAIYVQDKMEYEGMVANIGLRAEAYNFQSNYPDDPFNIFYQGTGGPQRTVDPYGNPATRPSKTKFILMPRLGLSFPIGETTAFRIQYGHFASMPIFTQALSQRTDQGWLVRGNPNLDFKKTINYEFGLQQMIDETHRANFAFYYNDRVTQVGTQRIASFTGSQGPQGGVVGHTTDNYSLYPYTTYSNNAFGSTIGIELTFEKISTTEWSYRLSYSLSQTNDGSYGTDMVYPDGSVNISRAYTGENLSYSDRTHSFRGLIQYTLGEEAGFSIFNVKPLQNTIFSLTYSAQSGLPFQYKTDYDPEDVGLNRRYPLEQSFDFNVTKNLSLGGLNLILGVRIMNLFNNKWLTPMSNVRDLGNWINKSITMDDPANTEKSSILSPFKTYRNIPRQIFFTLGIGF